MNGMLRAVTAGLVLGLGFVAIPTGITAAPADPIGNCTTTVGTIVAVDFSHWGGPVVRGCGVNNPSGYSLLHAAGFSTTGDNHDGPAYICRIGNQAFQHGTQYPTPAQDPCILTPPAAAYWSYWLAPAGQNNWTYSEVGSMVERPKPGEVELWIFGGTNLAGTTGSGVPSFSPDALRAHNATPTGVNPTPTTRASAPVTSGSAKPTSGPTSTNATTLVPTGPRSTVPVDQRPQNGTRPPDPTASSSTPTSTRPDGQSSVTTPDTGAPAPGTPRVISAMPAVAEHHSSGSMVPVLIGLGLVAVVGGATALSMVRRRRRRV